MIDYPVVKGLATHLRADAASLDGITIPWQSLIRTSNPSGFTIPIKFVTVSRPRRDGVDLDPRHGAQQRRFLHNERHSQHG